MRDNDAQEWSKYYYPHQLRLDRLVYGEGHSVGDTRLIWVVSEGIVKELNSVSIDVKKCLCSVGDSKMAGSGVYAGGTSPRACSPCVGWLYGASSRFSVSNLECQRRCPCRRELL